jgi:protein tyrosine/serine phosphatase
MRTLSEILYNFHWIVPGKAARSAQAYAGFLGPFLRSHGIATVINLRGPNSDFLWWRYETRICARLGIAHRDVMLNSRRLPTRQMLIDLLDAFDAAKTPLLLKCSGGQDRSSFAAALYFLNAKGWNAMDEALAQFARWPYLHNPKRHQRWLKPFLSFAQQQSRGVPLRQWLESEYTPERLRDWLVAQGLGTAFRGLYDVPGTAPGI